MFWLLKVRNEICSAAQGDAGTEEGKKIKVWLELLGGKISGQNQHFAQLQKKEKKLERKTFLAKWFTEAKKWKCQVKKMSIKLV